jgi:hypothetical protein
MLIFNILQYIPAYDIFDIAVIFFVFPFHYEFLLHYIYIYIYIYIYVCI